MQFPGNYNFTKVYNFTIYFTIYYINSPIFKYSLKKKPSRGVLWKSYSENTQ